MWERKAGEKRCEGQRGAERREEWGRRKGKEYRGEVEEQWRREVGRRGERRSGGGYGGEREEGKGKEWGRRAEE